jgi:hypothetical protein
MKRNRAILLFGSLATLVLGYAAWCGRTFYLSVPVPDLLELPEDYRADARSVIEKHGLTAPERFDRSHFLDLLKHPYASAPKPVTVARWSNADNFIVGRPRRYRAEDRQVVFWSTGIGWTALVTDYVTGSSAIERRPLRKENPVSP